MGGWRTLERRCGMSFSVPSLLVVILGFVLIMRMTRQVRRDRWRNRDAGVLSPTDLADIDRRLASVELLEARVLELENRLDFTERLLTSQSAQRAGE
jgi:hypothetical protein